MGDEFKIKKKNKYDESDDLQNSRDELMSSAVKKTTGRRRWSLGKKCKITFHLKITINENRFFVYKLYFPYFFL